MPLPFVIASTYVTRSTQTGKAGMCTQCRRLAIHDHKTGPKDGNARLHFMQPGDEVLSCSNLVGTLNIAPD
mgnify:FL=1